MKPYHSSLFVLTLAVLLAGCGGDKTPEKFTVAGTVTLDETPIEKGTISFLPADGNGPTAGAVIQNGRYSAEVPAGSKKVSIQAPKVVGQRKLFDTPDSPTTDQVKEMVPEKYNSKTTLTADIQGDKPDQNFALKTK